jgi:hypothetical protein
MILTEKKDPKKAKQLTEVAYAVHHFKFNETKACDRKKKQKIALVSRYREYS